MGKSSTNTTRISNHTRPRNERELFNLRHSSLCNIIERIFGVLKRQWRILDSPPEYDMHIQARVPAALCAVHNFIRHFDVDAFNDLEVDWDYMRFIEDGELPHQQTSLPLHNAYTSLHRVTDPTERYLPLQSLVGLYG